MNNTDNSSLLFIIETLKIELDDLKKSHCNLEYNYKNTKRELKELKEDFIKLKGNKIIF